MAVTDSMQELWHPDQKLTIWHQVWVEIMRLQPGVRREDIDAYERIAQQYARDPEYRLTHDKVYLDQLPVTRHEVVAALNAFNQAAGCDTAHLGLTSCDITETARQLQIAASMELVVRQAAHVLRKLTADTRFYADTVMVGRTHGQPAQVTSYGQRQGTIASVLADWVRRAALTHPPMRPIMGAVGTGQDLMRSCGWDAGQLRQMQTNLADRFGFNAVMAATRQTYHRSYDLATMGLLTQLGSIAHTWANDRRLEAMLGLGYEAPGDGQVGSSAMPHKRNPRYCERLISISTILQGDLATMTSLAGLEWAEGDVSGSWAGKRVWAGALLTTEQLMINWAYALQIWQPDLAAMQREVEQHADELATGAILQATLERGMDRTEAHTAIREAVRGGLEPRITYRAALAQAIGLPGFPEIGDITETALEPPTGVTMDLHRYLEAEVAHYGSVLAEMPPGWPGEVL